MTIMVMTLPMRPWILMTLMHMYSIVKEIRNIHRPGHNVHKSQCAKESTENTH